MTTATGRRSTRSAWGLVEVAQLANFRGTIWATWDRNAPGFDDYLGGARFALDLGLRPWDGGDGETEVLGSVAEMDRAVQLEIHRREFRRRRAARRQPPLGRHGRDRPEPGAGAARRLRQALSRGLSRRARRQLRRHAAGEGARGTTRPRRATAAYFQALLGKAGRAARRQGRHRAAASARSSRTCRSISSSRGRSSFRIRAARARPRCGASISSTRTRPTRSSDFLRSYYIRYSGPGRHDRAGRHGELELRHRRPAAAPIARRYPYNYKSCLGSEAGRSDPVSRASSPPRNTTEQNPRILYKRWAEYMDADDWRALAPSSRRPAMTAPAPRRRGCPI